MFKDKLKELRKHKNLTQEELAKELFVTRSAVAKWEQGRGLPEEETLHRLCVLFQITENELMAKEEPIQMIEKMDNNRKKYLGVILSLIMVFVIGVVSAIWYVTSQEPKNGLKKNQFFQSKTLSKYSLNTLNPIKTDGSDAYLSIVDNEERNYYCNVESQEVADQYASYVFSYLQNSLDVSFIGYSVDPINESKMERFSKRYVKGSSSFDDYLNTEGEYFNEHSYNFYYVTFKNRNHIAKGKMTFHWFSIEYRSLDNGIQSGLYINNEFVYFNVEITITTVGEEGDFYSYYLYDDYYDLEKIAIDQDNFNEYFFVSPSFYSNDDLTKKFRFLVGQNTWESANAEEHENYYFICDFSISVTAGKENKETKELRIKRGEAYGAVYFEDMDFSVDSETGEIKLLYDVEVKPGFIYKAIKK